MLNLVCRVVMFDSQRIYLCLYLAASSGSSLIRQMTGGCLQPTFASAFSLLLHWHGNFQLRFPGAWPEWLENRTIPRHLVVVPGVPKGPELTSQVKRVQVPQVAIFISMHF